MRRILRALALLAGLLPALAAAQVPNFPQTLPANTVVGRLGVGPGPSQAIPFATLGPTLITSNLLVTAPLSISGLTLSITGQAGKVIGGAGGTFTATPVLGLVGTLGSLGLAGNTSGTVTIQPAAAAGTWSLTLPTNAGTNGQVLSTNGSGITTWSSIGAGSITSATAGQLSKYTAATTLAGEPNLTVSGSTLTVGVATSALGCVALAGNTSGTTTICPNAIAGSGTLTVPSGTDTLVGRATTDTLTNKTLTAPTIVGGTANALTGFSLLNTAAAFNLTIVSTDATMSVGRSLTISTANASRTITLGGNTVTASDFTTSGAFPLTLTQTASTNVTLPITGTLSTLAGSEALTNKTLNGLTVTSSTGTLTIANGKTFTASNTLTFTGTDSTSFAFPSTNDTVAGLAAAQTFTNKTLTSPVITGGTVTALTTFAIRSAGAGAFDLTFNNTETLTAGRTLTLTINNAARTISLSGNLTTASDFTTAGSNALTLTTTGVTNVTLPISGTLAAINIAQTFSSTNIFSATQQFTDIKFSSGHIFPTSDSTTAIQITKADGTTRVLDVDTTNARVGINKTPGAFDLDVNGAANIGGVLTFGTLSATSLGASTSTVTGLTVNNSPSAANDYIPYYSAVDGAIRRATVGSIAAGATAGVSSLNGLTGGLSIVAGGGTTVSAAGASVTLGSNRSVVVQSFCASGCSTTIASGASGTYTPTSGMTYAVAYCYGGGGGGGGTANSSAGQGQGGGGGAGAKSMKRMTAAQVGASQTVGIGALGTGGASGNNNGGAGGDTSVGTLCIGKGGSGGAGAGTNSGGAGGAGGIAGTGDATGTGMPGVAGAGLAINTLAIPTTSGGSCEWGGGAIPGAGAAATTGNAGTGYCSGGGGGNSFNTGGAAAGGAGTAGIVIIVEHVNL